MPLNEMSLEDMNSLSKVFPQVQYKVEQYKNLRHGNNAVMVISMRFHSIKLYVSNIT